MRSISGGARHWLGRGRRLKYRPAAYPNLKIFEDHTHTGIRYTTELGPSRPL